MHPAGDGTRGAGKAPGRAGRRLRGRRARPRLLRCTRLAELTSSTDPKLVSAAVGIHPQAAIHYLADYVDDGRLHGTGPDDTGGH
ncbi:MAG: hypothetical protein ACRDND_02495 [Streptosporangiaceae bacterium]